MSSAKELRTQIGSIRNTQKITSAMEMVAASKMRKTQDQMARGRPYSDRILEMIGHLANADSEYHHRYMVEREVHRVGYIVVTTDKGLCGGLNHNLLREVIRDMRRWDEQSIEAELCLIGNKAAQFFRSFGGNVVAATSNLGERPEMNDLIGAIQVMLGAFEEGRVDKVFIAHNRFVNTMTQRPRLYQLVPLPPADDTQLKKHWDYIYEPDARDLMEEVVTRYIESQVYQAVVENVACEQAAKMVAMKSATDAAGDMIEDLELIMNTARQAAITQELAEIIGGAAAV